jgi:hypothetical protein
VLPPCSGPSHKRLGWACMQPKKGKGRVILFKSKSVSGLKSCLKMDSADLKP